MSTRLSTNNLPHTKFTLSPSSTPSPIIRAKLAIQLLYDQTTSANGMAVYKEQLPSVLVAHLRNIGDEPDETLPTILLTAFSVLISRYSGQHEFQLTLSDAHVGAPSFSVDLSEPPHFATLWQRIQEYLNYLQDQPTSAVPALPKDHSNILFTYCHQHYAAMPTALPIPTSSNSDLHVQVISSINSIQLIWAYQAGRFEAATIARMHHTFQTLLFGIIAQPTQLTSQLPLLTTTERQHLLARWSSSTCSNPDNQLIHELFEAQVKRTPEATAIIFGEEQLSFRMLNRRANCLARYLHTLGVGPDSLVGMCMERSPEQIVSVLGVLKAGAAYVPLDPANPPERLRLMLEDTRTPILLTQRHLLARLSAHNAQVVYVEDLAASEDDDINVHSTATPDNLAYVIYTSGSTGTPKGVQIEHRGLVNHTYAMINSHPIDARDRVLQFSSFSFDAAAASLFPALVVGATLILPEAEPSKLLGNQLTQICEQQRITILQLPASVWHRWVDDLAVRGSMLQVPLKALLVGGESPSVDKLRTWIDLTKHPMTFLNAYGPTEATITATLYQTTCSPAAAAITSVPIGAALANKQIYILDEYMQPVPIGVPGEIYIGGVGLARGYLNRPELTAERFINWNIPNFNAQPEQASTSIRIYRTGDLARYRADGNVEFLGRIDDQVKLRGFRIELGEIEATLRQHPAVRDTVVLAREDTPSNQRLVGYIVLHNPYAQSLTELSDALRTFLHTKLPEYMIPSMFVSLDALPLTSNGKLDRRALPVPTTDAGTSQATPISWTQEEAMLTKIWEQVLGRTGIGLHDNFFTLGGHSLLAPQAISLINATFKRNIPLRVLYEAPTIAAFTRAIRRTTASLAPHARANLAADVTLDPAITATAARSASHISPKAIFLTGPTGFLGAFLLNECLRKTSATIYCLVRATSKQEAWQRLDRTLRHYQITPANWHQRVVPLHGDLSQTQFGLSPETFQQLATSIDVIYHIGAQVHYLHSYDTLKAANVQGTVEVLRLACTGQLKPIHYTSTLAVAATDNGSYVHEDDVLNECTSTIGYVQSKWVAEGILRIARERGVPITIYRPGRIGGHSQTGASNFDDSFIRLLAGCIQLGCAPDIPLQENLIPVDYTAQAIMHLSQQPTTVNNTLHLLNPQPTSWQWLIGVTQELGYPLRVLPYPQWYSKLVQAVQENCSPVLHSLVILMPPHQASTSWIDNWTHQMFDMQNTTVGLANSAITCPVISRAILDQILAYSMQHGLFDSSPTDDNAVFIRYM